MEISYTIDAYTLEHEPIYRFRITNMSGAYVEFTNWGARWIAAVVPDKLHQFSNVLLGYPQLNDYLHDTYYMGAIIGRFANRIAGACFQIGEEYYKLERNDGLNTNHGGYSGFHQRAWQWEILTNGIRFNLLSPDNEGGWPGEVHVIVEYSWSEMNELHIFYQAFTDKATYVNLTNHAYFNLSGSLKEIGGHQLQIDSDRILNTTNDFIPTGEFLKVTGTPFDFTVPKLIKKDIHTNNKQLSWNRGYNHCYILKDKCSNEILDAAILVDIESGRRLKVMTDLPGILLYTAGYYKYPNTAVCLETQFWPDTPAHPEFPSCLLCKDELYQHSTYYKFDCEE